jgi:hypothetical protein
VPELVTRLYGVPWAIDQASSNSATTPDRS